MEWLLGRASEIVELAHEPRGFTLFMFAPFATVLSVTLGCLWINRKSRWAYSPLGVALYAYAGQLLGLYLSAGCLTLYFFSQYHPAHQVMDSVLRLAGLFVPPGVTVLAVRRGYCCTWPEAWQSLGYIVLISIAVWFLWALINSPAT